MSHKALTFSAPAAPFEWTDRTTPKPGSGEVLVKNVAVALNPVDAIIHHLGLWVDHYGYPAVGGCDAAGEIVAVGEGVQDLKKGDRVLYEGLWSPDRMTFQEYCITDGVQVSKIPSHISFEGAATIPLCFVTAALALYQERMPRGGLSLTAPWEEGGYKKYADQPAIVTGGSSSVGQFAIQLVKSSGFNPIITTASKHNEAYCKTAGATHVIDYHDVPYSELPGAVKKIISSPISLIFDAVSTPDSQKAVWTILAPNGKLAVVRPPAVGKAGEILEDGREISYVFGSANNSTHFEFGKKMFAGLTKLLEAGDVKPNNFDILPYGLAGVPDGLIRLIKGEVSGVKLVARVAETAGEVSGAGLAAAVPKHYQSMRQLFPVGSLPEV